MKDKISVIVPAYNAEEYLAGCVDSILAQTYDNIELIVVNDGSVDNTAQILDLYATRFPNIKAIHQANGGVNSARLRGIREATGEWITFADSDDWIEPQGLEILLRNAKQYQADISHYGYQRNLPDGRVLYTYNTGRIVFQKGLQGCRDLLDGSFFEPGLCNKLYRRELFEKIEEWIDRSIKINEDLLMNYFVFKNAQAAIFEDICPYHYVVHSGSATTVPLNAARIYDPIRVKEMILADAPEELRNDAKRAYINTCVSTYHTLLSAGVEYTEDLRKVRQRITREKDFFSLLGRKRQWIALLITHVPMVYKLVYGFYSRFLQKDVYS